MKVIQICSLEQETIHYLLITKKAAQFYPSTYQKTEHIHPANFKMWSTGILSLSAAEVEPVLVQCALNLEVRPLWTLTF